MAANNANIGFEKQIWDAACVLWGHIPAAEYRKVIVGLIFLRYISGAFERRYAELVVEGEGFEYVDGVPTFTDLVTDSEWGMRDALLIYASNGTINCVIDNNAVASGYSDVDKAAPEIWAEGVDGEYVIPSSMTLTAEEQTEAAGIYSDIQTLCMEYIAKFITGDISLDEYDSFVSDIESMGIQDYLDIYQTAYDRYMGN